MASATKKAKLDSNGVAQEEIAGLYDKLFEQFDLRAFLFVAFVDACARVKCALFMQMCCFVLNKLAHTRVVRVWKYIVVYTEIHI